LKNESCEELFKAVVAKISGVGTLIGGKKSCRPGFSHRKSAKRKINYRREKALSQKKGKGFLGVVGKSSSPEGNFRDKPSFHHVMQEKKGRKSQ